MAEIVLWKLAQMESWGKMDRDNFLYKLSPFLDDYQVLRVDGRLSVRLNSSHTTPVFPSSYQVTDLLIDHFHQRFGHPNKDAVVNELRRRFYVPRVRVCTSKGIESYQSCKLKKIVPLTPTMASLAPFHGIAQKYG